MVKNSKSKKCGNLRSRVATKSNPKRQDSVETITVAPRISDKINDENVDFSNAEPLLPLQIRTQLAPLPQNLSPLILSPSPLPTEASLPAYNVNDENPPPISLKPSVNVNSTEDTRFTSFFPSNAFSRSNYDFQRSGFLLSTPETWYSFIEAVCNIGLISCHLVEMVWYRTSGTPGHEYVILKFADAVGPPGVSANIGDHFFLRLERDTRSWFSIFPPAKHMPKNHVDFATIARDVIYGLKDEVCAKIVADQHLPVTPLHIILLLRHLREDAPVYDILSFNCWWYVGQLWYAIGYWIKMAAMVDKVKIETDYGIDSGSVLLPREHDWHATIFARNLLWAQLVINKRIAANLTDTTKIWLQKAREGSDTFWAYASNRLLDEAVDLVKIFNLSQERPSRVAKHAIAQRRGRDDKEFEGIFYPKKRKSLLQLTYAIGGLIIGISILFLRRLFLCGAATLKCALSSF